MKEIKRKVGKMKMNVLTFGFFTFLLLINASCTLFIDDELPKDLPAYNGKGYDEIVHETTNNYDITYKYNKSTIVLDDNNELMRHFVKVESNEAAGLHVLFFDGSTPEDLLPRPLQGILSSNIDIFYYGLSDMVLTVEKKNGQNVVTCKHTTMEYLFDDLHFSLEIPFDEYVESYDLLDDEGNVVAHVDNGPSRANSHGRSVKREEDADDYMAVDIPFHIDRNFAQAKGFGDNAEITLDGGLKCKLFCECDFSWGEGLTFQLYAKDGEFKIGYKVKISKGTDDPILIMGNDDLFDGKIRVQVGPVVVVPVLGISVNLGLEGGIETSFDYTKPFEFKIGFDGEDFYSESKTEEGEYTVDFEAYGTIEFPMIKLSIGFGIGTNAITYRFEVYLTLETKATISSAQFNLTSGKTDIQMNPKIEIKLKLGFAFALVAEGKVISKILNKIKGYIKEKFAKLKRVESGADHFSRSVNLTLTALAKQLNPNGELLSPEEAAIVHGLLEGVPEAQRMEVLQKKLEEMENLEVRHVPELNEIDEDANTTPPNENDDKISALRLGPFYLDKLTWPVYSNYLFPKMKEGSLRVGRKWDDHKGENLIFIPEFTLEAPGLLSIVRDFYPGFIIKLGSEEIMFLPANNIERLYWKTEPGRVYKAEIPGLYGNYTYTCIPGYAVSGGERPTLWDKPITFSATTPSLSIVDFKTTEASVKTILGENLYTFRFDTYTNVIGSRNISEWGILDNDDKNPFTKRHKNKSATLKSGSYIHHWSIKNTLKQKVTVSLSPYIFAKDDDKSNLDNAKIFPTYNETMTCGYDFSTNTFMMYQKKKNVKSDTENRGFDLELDSVTFVPDPYAQDM